MATVSSPESITVAVPTNGIPQQFSSSAGSVSGPIDGVNNAFTFSPAGATDYSILYRNGLVMTQPLDGTVTGPQISFTAGQTPQLLDTVSVESWIPANSTIPAPLNVPSQFSTNDGTITGAIDGSNHTFTLVCNVLVTEIILAWNGDVLTPGIDYTWQCVETSSDGTRMTQFTMTQYAPEPGDLLTVQTFFS